MEQTDTLLNGNKIIQDTDGFMFGTDAVLLADFACKNTKRGDLVIDLGTGTGIIPLLMEKGCVAASFTGLEVQQKYVNLATRSVELNLLTDKIKIVQGDLKNVDQLFTRQSFNVVVSNPPYALVSQGKQNARDEKTIARHEISCTLDDIIKEASRELNFGGSFCMVHKVERMTDILLKRLR